MPWENRSVEAMREQFVQDVLAGKASKSELCRKYKISRPTGDKWIKRYLDSGSVAELSRTPHSSPDRISVEEEQLIISIRKEFPSFGAVKLHRILEDRGYTNLPSVGTFNNVFRRNKLIDPVASAAARHIIHFEMPEPNAMWQIDFKGNFLLKDNTRCHTLNIVDDHTRFCVCCKAQLSESHTETITAITDVFREYGLPSRIQCDNGNPWGNAKKDSITHFEVHMMELGILVTHSAIMHPQTQGKAESFNRSFTRECLKGRDFNDICDAQNAFDGYRHIYNQVRPHHALSLATPASVYVPSPRRLPESISEWDYPDEYKVIKVMPSGFFYLKGETYFLSRGLGNKYIGLSETKKAGEYTIVFRQFRIGRLDLNQQLCDRKRIYLLEGDPRSNP